MSNIELGIKEELEFVLDGINEDRKKPIELTREQTNKIVDDILNDEPLWEIINGKLENEIYWHTLGKESWEIGR